MPSTPLFNPRGFFEKRTPSLAGAALILYATGVVAVASAAPFVNQFSAIDLSTSMLIVSVLIGGGVGTVGIWTVSTVLVYLLSSVAGGSGPVTQTAVNIGWAALPLLFVNTISTAMMWLLHFVGELPTFTPTQAQLPFWFVLVNTTIGVLGYLWIGYLLTYAVHDARDLAVRRAAPIAGFVVLIPIANAVVNLL